MVENPSRTARIRPLLLTLAVIFATATLVYSVAWMYYVRKSSLPVEIGIDNLSTPNGILVTNVEAAPTQDAEEFGDDRLIATLQSLRGKCACEMLDGIIAEVQRFSQSEQADDMTLIVARCR